MIKFEHLCAERRNYRTNQKNVGTLPLSLKENYADGILINT